MCLASKYQLTVQVTKKQQEPMNKDCTSDYDVVGLVMLSEALYFAPFILILKSLKPPTTTLYLYSI